MKTENKKLLKVKERIPLHQTSNLSPVSAQHTELFDHNLMFPAMSDEKLDSNKNFPHFPPSTGSPSCTSPRPASLSPPTLQAPSEPETASLSTSAGLPSTCGAPPPPPPLSTFPPSTPTRCSPPGSQLWMPTIFVHH